MSGDDLMFEEFIELCDNEYEYGLIEFKNGDIVNKEGENDGSAKVLSYAALAQMDKDMTLKVCIYYVHSLLVDHINVFRLLDWFYEESATFHVYAFIFMTKI